MLILSKFHDYYDTALATGVDKTIVYNRHTVKVEKPPAFTDRYIGKGYYPRLDEGDAPTDHGAHYTKELIGFCGKMHVAITNLPLKNHKNLRLNGKPYVCEQFFYDMESIENCDQIDKDYLSQNIGWRKPIERRYALEAAFKNCPQDENWFLDNKVVCFATNRRAMVNDDRGMFVNPCLKDYQFFKVRDSFSALQDIMMFISGVLGSPNGPVVDMPDLVMVASKGFDTKTSFRKAPTKVR